MSLFCKVRSFFQLQYVCIGFSRHFLFHYAHAIFSRHVCLPQFYSMLSMMQKINFPILQFDFCSNLKILCIPTRAFALTAFSFLEQRKEVCFSFFAFTAITHCSKNQLLSKKIWKKSRKITYQCDLLFYRLGWIEY